VPVFYDYFSTEGTPSTFSIAFGSAGTKNVKVSASCQGCPGTTKVASMNVVVSEPAPSNQSPLSGRFHNVVYITGHPWAEYGPTHLAIEFNDGSGEKWLSAEKISGDLMSDLGTLTNGLRPSDYPDRNDTFGIVIPPPGQTAAQLFSWLNQLDSVYCDCLDYEIVPLPWTNGYNSNGFVAGLINAGNGLSTVVIDAQLGGDKPVPKSEFGL